jgi:Eco57I restriction-modification methylase
MDLQGSLLSIRSTCDLPRLVAALGHQPLWEPLSGEPWRRGSERSFAVTTVGQTHRLPWFAVDSPVPERDARALARCFSRRGRLGIVLALNPEARRLAVAVAFERCPHIDLDLSRPDPEALASLARLAGADEGGSLGFAARAADALSTEPVGRRFFREFRFTLDRMAAGFPGPMAADDRHGLALLQLTRVLFLYFIQTKGWLAGKERFLAEEMDRCLSRKRRIHRDLLRPLFFGTLNRPIATRSRTAARFGDIPFLNGGLFEPHPLERRFRADIPNAVWRDAFDRLFERFHFTVAQGNETGSVAPDMLGRVFEGVMAPESRRASGTFYTPASLVERVLDTALTVFLASRLRCSESEAERRLREPDRETSKILSSLTVLDPAVGSGAFLLGALERLSGAQIDAISSAACKRRILQQNLFGVDLNASAVRLTELRLWLAVIADEPAGRSPGISPLPNLDCLIRQGDSLFDPMGVELAGARAELTPEIASQLARLRWEFVAATGAEKHSLLRRLRLLETRVLAESFEAADARYRAEITGCLNQARESDLFGRRRGLDRELRARLQQLRLGLRRVRLAGRRLGREGEVPWFHYQSHFADVFLRGGFDLVVGNPPWLRSEAIAAETRKQLAGRYRWWRVKSRGYGNSPDLAVAFLERALELAAPSGVVAMLVPAKIVSAGYGSAARHALASTTTLHTVADLTGAAAAEFEATVYPLAIVTRKAAPGPNHRVRTSLEPREGSLLRQARLCGGAPWILAQSKVTTALAALDHDHPKLGDSLTCHLGLKTGCNQVFLNPPDELEPELLRWAIRGRDVRAFRCESQVRLLWTHDSIGRPLVRLPSKARAYFARHESVLRARKDFLGGPPWTVFRAGAAVARYRVVWADLARRLKAVGLSCRRDLERIPLNSCYVVPVRSGLEADCLTAWLNSTWVGAAARLAAVPASGGFARFNAQAVARLPLPHATLTDPRLARLARAGRSGANIQDELDDLVAQQLGLSSSAQSVLRAAVDRAASNSR